jgi:hypothetical protein
MVDYLLSLGAPLNTKPNGGSRLLENLIGSLDFVAGHYFGQPKPGEMESKMALVEHVVNWGAKWIPDPDDTLRRQRDLDPGQLVTLFKILKQGGAASVEFLISILASPSRGNCSLATSCLPVIRAKVLLSLWCKQYVPLFGTTATRRRYFRCSHFGASTFASPIAAIASQNFSSASIVP